jgi:hypothetical protein
MTRQRSDQILFKGETYNVVWGTPLYFPEVWNLNPVPINTGCYKGWHCIYHVDDHLWLAEIEVGLEGEHEEQAKAGIGPRLFGALPQPHYFEYERWDSRAGQFVYGGVGQSGSWLYRPRKLMKDVEWLRISRDYLEEPSCWSWVYHIPVFDLHFHQGRLTKVVDQTEQVRLERLKQQALSRKEVREMREKMLRQRNKEAREAPTAKSWYTLLFGKR